MAYLDYLEGGDKDKAKARAKSNTPQDKKQLNEDIIEDELIDPSNRDQLSRRSFDGNLASKSFFGDEEAGSLLSGKNNFEGRMRKKEQNEKKFASQL